MRDNEVIYIFIYIYHKRILLDIETSVILHF